MAKSAVNMLFGH